MRMSSAAGTAAAMLTLLAAPAGGGAGAVGRGGGAVLLIAPLDPQAEGTGQAAGPPDVVAESQEALRRSFVGRGTTGGIAVTDGEYGRVADALKHRDKTAAASTMAALGTTASKSPASSRSWQKMLPTHFLNLLGGATARAATLKELRVDTASGSLVVRVHDVFGEVVILPRSLFLPVALIAAVAVLDKQVNASEETYVAAVEQYFDVSPFGRTLSVLSSALKRVFQEVRGSLTLSMALAAREVEQLNAVDRARLESMLPAEWPRFFATQPGVKGLRKPAVVIKKDDLIDFVKLKMHRGVSEAAVDGAKLRESDAVVIVEYPCIRHGTHAAPRASAVAPTADAAAASAAAAAPASSAFRVAADDRRTRPAGVGAGVDAVGDASDDGGGGGAPSARGTRVPGTLGGPHYSLHGAHESISCGCPAKFTVFYPASTLVDYVLVVTSGEHNHDVVADRAWTLSTHPEVEAMTLNAVVGNTVGDAMVNITATILRYEKENNADLERIAAGGKPTGERTTQTGNVMGSPNRQVRGRNGAHTYVQGGKAVVVGVSEVRVAMETAASAGGTVDRATMMTSAALDAIKGVSKCTSAAIKWSSFIRLPRRVSAYAWTLSPQKTENLRRALNARARGGSTHTGYLLDSLLDLRDAGCARVYFKNSEEKNADGYYDLLELWAVVASDTQQQWFDIPGIDYVQIIDDTFSLLRADIKVWSIMGLDPVTNMALPLVFAYSYKKASSDTVAAEERAKAVDASSTKTAFVTWMLNAAHELGMGRAGCFMSDRDLATLAGTLNDTRNNVKNVAEPEWSKDRGMQAALSRLAGSSGVGAAAAARAYLDSLARGKPVVPTVAPVGSVTEPFGDNVVTAAKAWFSASVINDLPPWLVRAIAAVVVERVDAALKEGTSTRTVSWDAFETAMAPLGVFRKVADGALLRFLTVNFFVTSRLCQWHVLKAMFDNVWSKLGPDAVGYKRKAVYAEMTNELHGLLYEKDVFKFVLRSKLFFAVYGKIPQAHAVLQYLDQQWWNRVYVRLWATCYRQDFTMLGVNTTAHIEGLFGFIKTWIVRALRGVDGLKLIEQLSGGLDPYAPSLVLRKDIVYRAAAAGTDPRGRTRASVFRFKYLLTRAELWCQDQTSVVRRARTTEFTFVPISECRKRAAARQAAAAGAASSGKQPVVAGTAGATAGVTAGGAPGGAKPPSIVDVDDDDDNDSVADGEGDVPNDAPPSDDVPTADVPTGAPAGAPTAVAPLVVHAGSGACSVCLGNFSCAHVQFARVLLMLVYNTPPTWNALEQADLSRVVGAREWRLLSNAQGVPLSEYVSKVIGNTRAAAAADHDAKVSDTAAPARAPRRARPTDPVLVGLALLREKALRLLALTNNLRRLTADHGGEPGVREKVWKELLEAEVVEGPLPKPPRATALASASHGAFFVTDPQFLHKPRMDVVEVTTAVPQDAGGGAAGLGRRKRRLSAVAADAAAAGELVAPPPPRSKRVAL
jgi:hypothetical protein